MNLVVCQIWGVMIKCTEVTTLPLFVY